MRRGPAVAAVVALLVGAACSGDDDAGPAPEPRVTTSTVAVDRSGIALAPVAGETTTTIRETGSARIVGAVRGPNGPVPGATVRIERFVAGRELRSDVVTDAEGRFVLERVPGGRYRVRAFLPPTLAQAEAEVRFLADGAEHEFDLVLDDQTDLVVRSSAAPSPALVGAPVNLVVLVAERRVDGDGIVRTAPVVGAQVELSGLGRWVLRDDGTSSATTRTDSGGRARWELECRASGDPGLFVRIPVTVSAAPSPAGQPQPGATTTTSGPQVRTEIAALELAGCETPTTSTTTGATTTSTSTETDG